ncbi:SDR family NAD(P)-dependent oxidoreductase [Nonomuraea diastatica]|uniref:SDR family NAD(P)-dependent oxidoreductase n=1 Tax=Nonomuraea diastatica TaxID=1848329 RepID=A0A4R4WG12_9ACTN|nr:SDR family NAD(P)-dependent oxidoreductase [Nonomuraea diastatica]TDD17251.1 SDR family NAD(P)-dependent oxidoreductase [Nonomuraea diastatica]
MNKNWLITGTSRGFGRSWTQAALKRGDRVAACARDTGALRELHEQFPDALLPIALDVTDREAAFAAVREAHSRFGRLDVVVNNAGYGHFGFVEEITEAEARAQLETNLLGALWVTQAAIPLLRAQGGGHILQVSSIGGVAAFPNLGIYHSSKWALEGLSEALSQEVAGFGIKVTIIEPGGYATDWGRSSAVTSAGHPVYQPFRDARAKALAAMVQPEPDDTAAAMLAVVDADEPPLRLLLSGAAYDVATGVYAARLKTWAAWEQISRAAGDPEAGWPGQRRLPA